MTKMPEKVKRNKNKRTMQFDLFAQLSYMASLATAGVPRSTLFEQAAGLPYVSSQYFENVAFIAKHMNIDYSEACRMEADRTKDPEVRGLLLRFSGALSSGEDETEFLRREAEIIGETYSNQYARDVESLKKWTDAYVALVVAAGLIVIVAVISMMIYEVGTTFIVGLSIGMVGVTCFGAWLIYASAPREIKTRVKGPSSKLQKQATFLFKTLLPIGIIVTSLMTVMKIEMGIILLAGAAFIMPAGFVMRRDDGRLTKKDMAISTMVRVLGGVTAATGTTLQESLGKIDKRSMGELMPEVERLRFRLVAGIKPDMCWDAFVDEIGSELIERTVSMFWDSINVGGEPGVVGNASAYYSSKIAFLRATRTLVATTFQYLALPLHVAMVGLLVFILEIMALFSSGIGGDFQALEEATADSQLTSTGLGISELFSFGQVNLQLVGFLVTSVVLVLTITNAFAPKAAAGGHNYKLLYNLAANMIITGVLMIAVPRWASSMFDTIMNSHP